MPTDAQMAQITAKRKKDLIAAEIEARRKAAEYAMGLLAGFDPDSPVATQSVMGPDPTWQGTGYQEVLGDKETILDRLIQPPVDVPTTDRQPIQDMPPLESDVRLRLPLSATQRPSLDQADYPADLAGTSEWLRNMTFDLGRKRRDHELGDYRREQRLLRERGPLTSDAGTWTPTTEQIAALQDQDGFLTERDQVADSASTLLDRRIPTGSAGTAAPTALVPRAEPTQQQPTRPYWDSIESIYGPNVRARVGDARADEMEMDRFGPAVTPGAVTRAPTTDARTTAKAELSNDVSILNQIKRKKNILRAVSSIWGTKDNSSSYEANAVAKYKDIVNQRALQSILKKGVPDTNAELSVAWLNAGGGVDYLPTVLNMGLIPNEEGYVTLYNHEDTKAKPWTGRIDSPEFVKRIKSRDWHQDKPVKDPVGRSMRFVDPEGVGHLGYVKTDENGLPRYFLRDDTKVPEGWDMQDPAANKTEITNNLGKQGEKMPEARQVAMAQMSRKWSNDAAGYFFDEGGSFKADRWDIIKSALNVPGEGRLAWTQMKNALASALRLESGAAIGVEEAANFKSRFFPEVTDTERTIIWKLRAFGDYIRALEEINNPQWVYENLPHPAWNPKKVRTEKERDALPHGSYFITPSGNLGRYLPNQTEAEVTLP